MRTREKKKKVAVGLSGGVDSAVSAALLVEQGYEVTGVYLECWSFDKAQGKRGGCRADEDRKDALEVALELGIPYKVLDFRKEYREKVVEYFYREYRAGRTPNPDTMCNREIKFGLFYDWALRPLGKAQGKQARFDYVATGHYARIEKIKNQKSKIKNTIQNLKCEQVLLRGIDKGKDQSYFLYQLRPEQLAHVLFPIGGMTKEEVRKEAKKRGLGVADKPDSQGICFVGKVGVRSFLKDLGLKEEGGEVVVEIKNQKSKIKNKIQNAKDLEIENSNLDIVSNLVFDVLDLGVNEQPPRDHQAESMVSRGEMRKGHIINSDISTLRHVELFECSEHVIGRHEGVWFYTIGQRLGRELDHKKISELCKSGVLNWDPQNLPSLFVVEKDVKTNRLVLGVEKDLKVSEFGVGEINWLMANSEWQMADGRWQIENGFECYVRIRNLGELVEARIMNHESRIRVITTKPLRGVAEGQACVFYSDDSEDAVVLGGGVIMEVGGK